MTPTNGSGNGNNGTPRTGSPKKKNMADKYRHWPLKAGQGGSGRCGQGGRQAATLTNNDMDLEDKGERDDKWAIKTVRRIWKIPWTCW